MSASEHRQVAAEGAGTEAGRRLAEARQAQHQSAADIARQLKLSVAQVEALESGHYERLPGPIFVRGFIRNYARLVRLDPNELLRTTEATAAPAASPPDRAPSRDIPYPAKTRRRWPLAVAGLAVIAALAAYVIVWEDAHTLSQSPEITAPTAQTRAAAPAPAPQETVNSTEPVVAAPEEPSRAVEPPPQAEAASPPAADAATASAQPSQAPPRAGEKRVMLEFEDESWVEIRDRNERVIFSQLNRPGTQQRVDGLPPFSVVVGNAQAVRLTFDGKSVDLGPHTRVDVARLILQ